VRFLLVILKEIINIYESHAGLSTYKTSIMKPEEVHRRREGLLLTKLSISTEQCPLRI
jgi:hypothetical protein